MKSIRVPLKDRSYDISFGKMGPSFMSAVKKAGVKPSRALIVTSQRVAHAGHANTVKRALARAGVPSTVVAIPNGEKHKNLKTLSALYTHSVNAGLDRRSLVVGVGGGVVTDLAGFLAATYMRGIAFISVPTTILGMVDAAIGGKTGVDLPAGKNLVGAFWQPKLVWIDLSVLKTLPAREWSTGFAEIVKYGVIKDRSFFNWLERKIQINARPQTWSIADIGHAIEVSAAIKANVVGGDEREKPLGGGREILNFGHTIGHALEAASSYNALSHGEAISIGMVAVGFLVLEKNGWRRDDQLQLLSMLDALGLPTHRPSSLRVNNKRF
jgi:3-dehydroquinate synthase